MTGAAAAVGAVAGGAAALAGVQGPLRTPTCPDTVPFWNSTFVFEVTTRRSFETRYAARRGRIFTPLCRIESRYGAMRTDLDVTGSSREMAWRGRITHSPLTTHHSPLRARGSVALLRRVTIEDPPGATPIDWRSATLVVEVTDRRVSRAVRACFAGSARACASSWTERPCPKSTPKSNTHGRARACVFLLHLLHHLHHLSLPLPLPLPLFRLPSSS